MKEQLITFETAKLAKEKGFIELSVKVAYHEKRRNEAKKFRFLFDKLYLAPTQSFLQKWLREVHGIPIWIIPYSITNYSYHYFKKGGFTLTQENFKDYETSLESALYNGLKMI